jgi:hypothetical protein
MARTAFLIGNGFDLDLGFKTKYSDYFNIWDRNNHWPFKDATSGLGGYINQCAKTDKWLDLEKALFDYAAYPNGKAITVGGVYPIDSDRDDFNVLVTSLTQYINRIPWETSVNKESVASAALKTILDNGDYAIYSFNYTNLRRIGARLYLDGTYYNDKEYDLQYTPIHGTVDNQDIILGVHSDATLIEGYEFLRKIDQPLYKSNNLQQDILTAHNVVFFGLSMGIIDYPYFRDFFAGLCTGVIPSSEKRNVTLFTYDENSRLQLLKQLRELTGTDLMRLKSNCHFEIIRTSCCEDEDKQKFNQWLEQID